MTAEEAYWAGLGPEEMEFDAEAARARDEAEADAELAQIERDSCLRDGYTCSACGADELDENETRVIRRADIMIHTSQPGPAGVGCLGTVQRVYAVRVCLECARKAK